MGALSGHTRCGGVNWIVVIAVRVVGLRTGESPRDMNSYRGGGDLENEIGADEVMREGKARVCGRGGVDR